MTEEPTTTADRRSIGDVVAALRPEFPDISISKIRFLEAEGLLTPQRTGSGYRTYSGQDVERLHYILAAQRDRFWPLKVIRESLDALDRGLRPASSSGDEGRPRPTVPPPEVDPHLPTAAEIARPATLRLTAAELAGASGLDEPALEALETYGLLRRRGGQDHFDESDLAVARAAGALAAYGIEPRHLRAFRTAADREVGLVQQVVSPLRGRAGGAAATPDGSPQDDPAAAVMAHCIALHVALVRVGLQQS